MAWIFRVSPVAAAAVTGSGPVPWTDRRWRSHKTSTTPTHAPSSTMATTVRSERCVGGGGGVPDGGVGSGGDVVIVVIVSGSRGAAHPSRYAGRRRRRQPGRR